MYNSFKDVMVEYTKEYGKQLVKDWWVFPVCYGLGASVLGVMYLAEKKGETLKKLTRK